MQHRQRGRAGDSTRAVIGDPGPTGLYDLLGEKSIPIFEGSLDGEPVIEGHFGAKKVADNISIWLPGVLKVDPWPQAGMNQFEWYVPVDATTHCYLQVLGRMTKNQEEADAFREEVAAFLDTAPTPATRPDGCGGPCAPPN